MKKIIALVLALCMALSACVALADEAGLKDARSYINLMYKNKPASTPKDYEVVGSVPTDGDPYQVEWTTDSDTITVTRLESGMVKIDVDEDNPKVVEYKLTATIKDAEGGEISISFDRFVPAAINLDIMTEEEIVAVAYTLEDQAKLPAATALCGDIVAIPSAYSEQYGNITVNIQVGDLKDQPIQCYRLTGEGAADLKVGDHIAVFGVIKNYKGTIEFDAGCILIPESSCQSARVAGYVYTLEEGASMNRASTVTGVITAIPSAYSPDYQNITVNIDVPGLEGYTIQCYRLAGGEELKEGDAITVTGTIKNYKGTIEFDKGCTYVLAAEEAQAAPEVKPEGKPEGKPEDKPEDKPEEEVKVDLLQKIKEILETYAEDPEAALEEITKLLIESGDEIGDELNSVIQMIQQQYGDKVELVSNLIEELAEKLKDSPVAQYLGVLTDAVSSLTETVSNLVTEEQVEEIKEGAKELVNGILNWFGNGK